MAAQDQKSDQAEDTKKANDNVSQPDQKDSQTNPDISASPITPRTINEESDKNQSKKSVPQSPKEDTTKKDQPSPNMQGDPTSENAQQTDQSNKESTKTSSQPEPPSADSTTPSNPDLTSPSPTDSMSSNAPPSTPAQPGASDVPDQPSDQQGSIQDNQIPSGKVSKPGGSGSKYNIVIGILLVFALAGLSFAGYQYYQTRIASNQTQQENGQQQSDSPTPTPEPEIGLSNGNVVSTTADGQETIIVNKTSFDTTGITGFTNLKMSPNEDRICFHTAPPSPAFAIYLSDLTGQSVTEVARERTNCHWLGNGQSIVYEGAPSEDESVNIYMYDIQASQENTLTDTSAIEGIRIYNIEDIADDGTTVLCSYQTSTADTPVDCEIDTSTGEITIPTQQQ